MKVVDGLAKFLIYQDFPKTIMRVLLILSYITDEDQTHLLISHDSAFDLMLYLAISAWKSADHRCKGFSLLELMKGMCGLSRNDDVKVVLVDKGVLVLITAILSDNNFIEKEKENAAKLLWELSFDKNNKSKILQDAELMDLVNLLSKDTNRKVSRACQGVLWVTEMDKKQAPERTEKKIGESSEVPQSDEQTKSGHVMISYNWEDQKQIKEIRDALIEHNFHVWMDIDKMSGSTLEAMADAVEKASVVLVCASERYKESLNCRSEAEYAFTLKKPIIPLIMKLNYKPDGWLGILFGAKLFFNFSGAYPFDMKLHELVKELGDRGKAGSGNRDDTTDGAINATKAPVEGKASIKSEPFNVTDWLRQHDLDGISGLQDITEEQINFLKRLSSRAPEFYNGLILDLVSGKVTTENFASYFKMTSAIDKS